jgi:hypothetical protein
MDDQGGYVEVFEELEHIVLARHERSREAGPDASTSRAMAMAKQMAKGRRG